MCHNIPPHFRSKYESIAGMITAFCDERLEGEFADLSLHALQKLCRKRTEPMASGRDNECDLGANKFDFVANQIIGINGLNPSYSLKKTCVLWLDKNHKECMNE